MLTLIIPYFQDHDVSFAPTVSLVILLAATDLHVPVRSVTVTATLTKTL